MENEIGKRIRLYRKMKHITQEELGKKIGVSQMAITHYECGNRKTSIEQIRKIASALNVSVGELIGTEQEAPKEQQKETNLPKREVMELLEHIEDEKALIRIKHMIIGMGFAEE